MRHVRHSCGHVPLGHLNVGTFEKKSWKKSKKILCQMSMFCWDIWKKKDLKKKQVRATHKTQLRPCSVGTLFCWHHWKTFFFWKQNYDFFFPKKESQKTKSNIFLTYGPDNKRTKEKRKTIKIKETKNLKNKISSLTFFFFKYFLSHFSSALMSIHQFILLDILLDIFTHPFVTHTLTHSQRNRKQYI